MNWYDPGEEVESTAVAHYMSFKTLMDNQYGQLDSIIQLTTQNVIILLINKEQMILEI